MTKAQIIYLSIFVFIVLLLLKFLSNKSINNVIPEGECCTVKEQVGGPEDIPSSTYCKKDNKFYLYEIGGWGGGKYTKSQITEQVYLQGKQGCS